MTDRTHGDTNTKRFREQTDELIQKMKAKGVESETCKKCEDTFFNPNDVRIIATSGVCRYCIESPNPA